MNSHPLFGESNARHRAAALSRMRKLLLIIGSITVVTVISWVTVSFLGEPYRNVRDPNNANGTISVEVAQLMVDSWYPWDPKSGAMYFATFVYQVFNDIAFRRSIRLLNALLAAVKGLELL